MGLLGELEFMKLVILILFDNFIILDVDLSTLDEYRRLVFNNVMTKAID